jgi:hypothetical protein
VLSYATSEATANDQLVAGPSGAGYTYPSHLPPAKQQEYAQLTASLMHDAGMKSVNVIDDFPTTDTLKALFDQPEVSAIFGYTYGDYYSGLRGTVTWSGDKPLVGSRVSLWDDANSSSIGKVQGPVGAGGHSAQGAAAHASMRMGWGRVRLMHWRVSLEAIGARVVCRR